MAPRNPRPDAAQTVAVKIVASGAQSVSVYTQTPTGVSAYITVVTPNVMVTVHDQVAMRTYANAWTDMRTAALHLPKFRGIEVEKVARRMPGLVIAAHGADRTFGVHRTEQNDIVIRIGYLTWILADNLAFRSMTEALGTRQGCGREDPAHLPHRERRHQPAPSAPATDHPLLLMGRGGAHVSRGRPRRHHNPAALSRNQAKLSTFTRKVTQSVT